MKLSRKQEMQINVLIFQGYSREEATEMIVRRGSWGRKRYSSRPKGNTGHPVKKEG